MKRLLVLLAFISIPALAADDPKAQIEFLEAALAEVQTQRNTALDQLAIVKARAAAQIAALQRRVDELTKPEAKPK